MIKKVVIIDEADWNRLTLEVAHAIWDQYGLGYGYKLVSNETGSVADSLAEVVGVCARIVPRAVEVLNNPESRFTERDA